MLALPNFPKSKSGYCPVSLVVSKKNAKIKLAECVTKTKNCILQEIVSFYTWLPCNIHQNNSAIQKWQPLCKRKVTLQAFPPSYSEYSIIYRLSILNAFSFFLSWGKNLWWSSKSLSGSVIIPVHNQCFSICEVCPGKKKLMFCPQKLCEIIFLFLLRKDFQCKASRNTLSLFLHSFTQFIHAVNWIS